MFLFLRLILAHLLGDFVIQPDELYRAKKKNFWGASIHYFVILLLLVIFSYPYLGYLGCWIVIIFATLMHIILDEIKLRVNFTPRLNFIIFILDQILHLVFLSPILYFAFAYTPPPSFAFIFEIYNNNSLIIFIIGYILSIFTGAHLWEVFTISYFRKVLSPRDPSLVKIYVIKYGMFERFIITTSFLGGFLPILLLIPLAFRTLSKNLFFSKEAIFNLFYASMIGFILRQNLPLF
jgi:hypothetical protein